MARGGSICLAFILALGGLSLRGSARAEERQAPEAIDEVVRAAVIRNYTALHRCYRKSLARDRTKGGTVFIAVTLAAGEAVGAARVAQDELSSPAAAQCVLRLIRSVKLPGVTRAGASPGDELVIPITFSAVPDQQAVQTTDAPPVELSERVAVRPLLTPSSVGARDIGLALLALEGGRYDLPARQGVDQALFVLEGRAVLSNGAAGQRTRLRARAAVWLPAFGRFSVQSKGARLLWLTVPAHLMGELAAGAAPTQQAGQVRWPAKTRPTSVKPRRLAEGVTMTPLLVRQRIRHQRFYLGLLTVAPQAAFTTPAHPQAAQALFVLKGRGKLETKDDGWRLEPGLAVYLPRGGPSRRLRAQEALQLVQIFAPAGAEQTPLRGAKETEP